MGGGNAPDCGGPRPGRPRLLGRSGKLGGCCPRPEAVRATMRRRGPAERARRRSGPPHEGLPRLPRGCRAALTPSVRLPRARSRHSPSRSLPPAKSCPSSPSPRSASATVRAAWPRGSTVPRGARSSSGSRRRWPLTPPSRARPRAEQSRGHAYSRLPGDSASPIRSPVFPPGTRLWARAWHPRSARSQESPGTRWRSSSRGVVISNGPQSRDSQIIAF